MKNEIKKLALGKMTIANLSFMEMNQQLGGLSGGSGCICGSTEPDKKSIIKKP